MKHNIFLLLAITVVCHQALPQSNEAVMLSEECFYLEKNLIWSPAATKPTSWGNGITGWPLFFYLGDKVILYKDIQYRGTSKAFDAGNYVAKSLGALTNSISSQYIPYGWSVQVRDSKGNYQTFTNSIANLQHCCSTDEYGRQCFPYTIST